MGIGMDGIRGGEGRNGRGWNGIGDGGGLLGCFEC